MGVRMRFLLLALTASLPVAAWLPASADQKPQGQPRHKLVLVVHGPR